MAVDALRQRGFLMLWLSTGINHSAFFLRSVIQGWLVLQLTNSSTWVGLVNGLPVVVSAPITFVAGSIADRYDPRQILIWTRMATAFLLFMTGFLISTGTVDVYKILLLAMGLNSAYYLAFPANQTFILTLVGPERLLTANALVNGFGFGFNFIGPAAAGFLAAQLGIDSVYYALGLAYVAAMVTVWFTPAQSPGARAGGSSMFGDVVAGLAYVRTRPGLAWILYVALLSVIGAPFNAILPALARDGLGLDAVGFGVLAGSQGIGSLIGSYIILRHGLFRRKGLAMLGGALIWTTGMLLMGSSSHLWQAVLVGVGMGFSPPLWMNSAQTVILTAVPPAMRSRMASLFALAFQAVPAGYLLGGVLADMMGPADTLKVLAVIGMLLHAPPLFSREFRSIG